MIFTNFLVQDNTVTEKLKTMYVIKRRQETYRGTDREKISTNEEKADKKKQRRLEDENDRQKCRLIQRKEEETFMRKGGGGNAR